MLLREVPAREAEQVISTVFAGLSARSRYLRFHSPVPRLTRPLLRHLADLDGRRRIALVAEVAAPAGPTPIGLAHLADLGDGAADVALAVVDAWQGHGIGGRLLAATGDRAAELGYTELRGLVLQENLPMRRLVRRTFPRARMHDAHETIEFSTPIGPAGWAVTEEDVLADLLRPGR